MDNGPEFTGPVRLVGTDGAGLRFIEPGKPIQNAFVGTVRSAISRRNGSRAGSARPDSMTVRAPGLRSLRRRAHGYHVRGSPLSWI
jgi:hypothetical protein